MSDRKNEIQKMTSDVPQSQVYESIRAALAAKGYVTIDFYDGSIMYDFEYARTVICDIDFYVKSPYINNMGRLWGSSRFMSLEEFQVAAGRETL